MLFCYLCEKIKGKQHENFKYFESNSVQSAVIESLLKDYESKQYFLDDKSNLLCLACNTVLLHMDYLQKEICVLQNIIRRRLNNKYTISKNEHDWLEVDHEAFAHFELKENIYYCLQCSFQTHLFHQISIHYKYHQITQNSYNEEIERETEIELVNCDKFEYNEKSIKGNCFLPNTIDNSVFSDCNEDDDVNSKYSKSEIEENLSEDVWLSKIDYLERIDKNIRKCSLCNFSSKSYHTIKHHLNQHFNKNSKTKRNCKSSRDQFHVQDKNIPTLVQEKLNCDACQKQFNSHSKLQDHIRTSHRQINVSFCEYCGFRLDTNGSCDHTEAILKDFPEILCEKCDIIFYQKHLLMEHQYNIHLICRICQKTFFSKTKLKVHESKHPKQPFYECSWCEKTFISKNGLKFHSSVHTGLYNFECDKCDKKFAHKKGLAEHMSVHSNEPRYICALCGKSFMYDASYRIHRKWHDDPYPAKCKLCPQKFRHPTMLAKHRRAAHEGCPPEYICRFCSKKFSTSSSRRCHEMLHSGNFPFKCEICNRGFSRKNHYAVHMQKIHNDDSILRNKNVCQYKITVPPEDQNYNNSENYFDNDQVHIQIEIERQPNDFEKYFESYIDNSTFDSE